MASAFRVYFFNDQLRHLRAGLSARSRGSAISINLGELVFLAGVLYLALLHRRRDCFAAHVARRRRADARCCAKSDRASIASCSSAFVASAVVPVVVLAFATRTYLANQFRAGVEDIAVKTATVAQRLVEDYAALQQRGANSLQLVDDQFMVLVRWAIDQDVNLFDRARLQATSERRLVRVAPAAVAHAEQRLSQHRARSAADERRRRGRRRPAIPAGRGAGPHRRPRGHRHRAAAAPRVRKSSGSATSSTAGCSRRRCCSCCSAPRSATGWPSALPIRSTG